MQNNPFNMYAGEYEDWFRENPVIFQSELEAIKRVMSAESVHKPCMIWHFI